MPYTIAATLAALAALQATVTITSPITETIKKAYTTIPKQSAMPETPCFLNFPKPMKVSHMAGSRSQRWQIRSQLLAFDADDDRAADIALAYLTAYIDKLS